MRIGAQHIDEPGLVVLDVTAADETTAHAVMAENGSFIHGPEAVQRVRATDRSAVSAKVRGRGATSPRSKRLFMSGRKVPYDLSFFARFGSARTCWRCPGRSGRRPC
ncbi:DUF6207 family protein [Streptomyces sp. NPDC057557]|uniref:DUF6207 family protein n=1 Tax=Streptomyces sp. NPDC057557 TaxID=3346167 RepID=UPI00367C9061